MQIYDAQLFAHCATTVLSYVDVSKWMSTVPDDFLQAHPHLTAATCTMLEQLRNKCILAHYCLANATKELDNLPVHLQLLVRKPRYLMDEVHIGNVKHKLDFHNLKHRLEFLNVAALELGYGQICAAMDFAIVKYLIHTLCYPRRPSHCSGIVLKEPASMTVSTIGSFFGAIAKYNEPQWSKTDKVWQLKCWMLTNGKFGDFEIGDAAFKYAQVQIQIDRSKCLIIDAQALQLMDCPTSENFKITNSCTIS